MVGAVDPTCVFVEYLGSDRIREPYELRTGAAEACYDASGLDRDRWHPLPRWVTGALPDAPYTLELVYYDPA